MTSSTLTSKHQTTIPKAVVEALKLRPSDQLVYEIDPDGRVILSAKTGSFQHVADMLKNRGKDVPARTVTEMKESVKRKAVKRFTRGKP
jgi:bifunctional DNA-binding transcriptional regulator/antitoxin component of YhaV-PrlF toxin-antitoxin module